jgi:prepilin-type processing-associated H-X9-DG protein
VLAAVVAGLHGQSVDTREKAQQQVCLSNVKQLSLALLLYTTDNRGPFPPAQEWMPALYPYVETKWIYVCPKDEVAARRREPDMSPAGPPTVTSYIMNAALGGKAEGSLAAPETMVWLFEGGLLAGDPANAIFRHFGKLNVAYVDGHGALLSEQEFAQARFTP